MIVKDRLSALFAKIAVFFVFLLSTAGFLSASNADTIGLSIPLSGNAAEPGQNFRTGAKLAMEKHGQEHRLFIADDGCDPDLGAMAASDLKQQNSTIVVGLICNAPAKAVADEFADTDVPVLVAGARSVRLVKDREREAWNLWRLSPGDDYPVEIAAQSINRLWQTTPYAIVDDGTIYGRNFTDALRAKMDEAGLTPQFSDTFRAAQSTQAGLLRRLQRSGVTAVFIASATVEDLFTIARNMKEFDINLDLMTSDALAVLPFIEDAKTVPAGVKVIMAPVPANKELEKLLAEREIQTDRQIYNGYAAIQIATQIINNKSKSPLDELQNRAFETILGTVRFNADGSSKYNPYKLQVWDGENLVPHDPALETQ
ncbi:MAG: branched-chain amino acid ABC transporter substrate-binding protein [Pseudomonadota bacterium]